MSSQRITVLHLLDHSLPVQDGYAYRSAAIIREQRALGWQTTQLTSDRQEDASAADDGVEYRRTTPYDNWLARQPVAEQLATVMSLTASATRVAQDCRPQLLQAHSPCLAGLAGIRVARRLGLPLVYEMRASWEDAAVSAGQTTEGSLRYRLSRALETHVLRAADAVTTICEGLRTDIIARGIPAEKVTVIPNGVQAERFHVPDGSGQAIRAAHARPDQVLIGFIGSFFSWEGLDVLIRAVDLLRQSRTDFKVLLIGDGPEAAQLRALTGQLGLHEYIDFGGRIPAAEVPVHYAAMDMLVYPRPPSPLTEKVTPLKPIEAMAAGRIVLASDVAGHREIVREGDNGLLFPAGDAAGLARALGDALARKDLASMRENGRRFASEERSWSASVARYGAVYERLLKSRERH